MEEKWIKHYSNHHKILLVGEGDFSFALSLANAFGSASNMVATSRDSKGSLIMKYSRAFAILKELETLGCSIVHEVDAHSVHKHPMLQNKFFDRIVYNFPHAGFGLAENNSNQIWLHKEVVLGFLKSAKKMLTIDGEIHITHKNNKPFSKWEIVKLADNVGLVFVEKVPFNISDYPGYVNKRGSGENCDGTFPIGDSSTFKFSKPKYMKSISLGPSVVLEDSDSVQLKNYVSKTMLVSQNQKALRIDSKMEGRWIKHYSSCHKILLVGEGDFSFALCLARALCCGSNLVATSLDSKESSVEYYRAWANLIDLKLYRCTILHEVDALSMDQHPLLLHKSFDRIVFNFPQDARFPFPEYPPYKIRNHQKLVLGFLHSARKMLSCNGEIHVTLKRTYPFNKWEVVKLAEKAGLVLVEKVPFKMKDYPCYANKRGSGYDWDEKFYVGKCSTFKFSKPKDVESFVGISEISIDPNSLGSKYESDCELKSSNEDHEVSVSTSTNSNQANTATNLISMCTIL
ncbi:25S rRNA (uracil(2634)-N(3))-methyltransferase [Trifolium repens]|nr:25S rRNA (uracil(2634)-N(3))-methyltransferase [Trifolium repens]